MTGKAVYIMRQFLPFSTGIFDLKAGHGSPQVSTPSDRFRA
jgi:hypothetical protein